MEEKLPVNFGPAKKSHKSRKLARKHSDIAPVIPHAPGQTFHPETTPPPKELSPSPVMDEPPAVDEVLDLPRSSSKLPIAARTNPGGRLLKELMWLILVLLVLAAGGLAAIYFLKI
jgi:hypothetical protein